MASPRLQAEYERLYAPLPQEDWYFQGGVVPPRPVPLPVGYVPYNPPEWFSDLESERRDSLGSLVKLAAIAAIAGFCVGTIVAVAIFLFA